MRMETLALARRIGHHRILKPLGPISLLPEKAALLLPFRQVLPESGQRLRVGVVLDSGRHSAWIDALQTFLSQIPGIDVQVLSLTSSGQAERRRPPWLADRLYSLSRARFDPFDGIAAGRANSAAANSASIDAIRSSRCGVLIWLSCCKDP